MQQQSGSHHSISPEYGVSAEMIPDLVNRWRACAPLVRNSFRSTGQDKVLVGEVEEQSVLAAEQARRAKDRLTKEFEQVPGYKGVIHISWRLSNRRATLKQGTTSQKITEQLNMRPK